MNDTIFWDMAPLCLYVNRRFGGIYHLNLQGKKSAEQEISLQHVARQNSVRRYIAEDVNIIHVCLAISLRSSCFYGTINYGISYFKCSIILFYFILTNNQNLHSIS
jgi:hypothetical protein